MNTLLSHEQLNQQDLALSSQGHSVLRPSLGLVAVGFLIAGMLYATASVSIAQLIFPKQANGSLIELNGKIIGSSLVGQNFVSEQYFHGRPSAVNYNVDGMAGSNLAISNPDLQKQIKERTAQFAQNNQMTEQHVPNEMVTASGSGGVWAGAALAPVLEVMSARLVGPISIWGVSPKVVEGRLTDPDDLDALASAVELLLSLAATPPEV